MDRRQRLQDLNLILIAAFASGQADMWTAMPAKIAKVDLVRMVVDAQPVILGRVQDKDGTWKDDVQMPLLLDMPIIFPSGGGYTLTFPVAVEDECLVVFSSRCIDGWWQQGGLQKQLDVRMHHLSDGFALVGPRSLPSVIPAISSNSTQLRSDAGDMYVEVSAAQIKLHHPTKVLIDAPATEVTGSLTVDGLLTYKNGIAGVAGTGNNTIAGGLSTTGSLTNDGKDVGSTHTHSGVTTGGGSTGAPN